MALVPARLTVHLVCLALAAAPLAAQRGDDRGSIVIVTGQQATLPIPTLMEGAASSVANTEIADQLFLRLADLGPGLVTAGDKGFVPRLARSWSRRDSLTLVFDLDPRARWHDGTPVSARDVLFSFERARDPALAPKLATLLRYVSGVTAEGDRRVVVRFSRPYAEQFYDATFHAAPLPAHLLAGIPPEQLAQSAYARNPVGSGPFRWVRSVAGEYTELAANDSFFLGRPKLDRVIVRVAADADARINLMLSGEADATDNIPPPPANIDRVGADLSLRLVRVASPTVGYLLFNQRDPRDRERPHPILADADVRRALILALDRDRMVRATFGAYADVPYGPASPLLWIRHGAPKATAPDPAAARKLLARAGWRDSDGDGILDRNGQPLALALSYPNTSGIRAQLALIAQEQLRQVGVQLDLQRLDGPVWFERRTRGDFDIDFSAASQDPTPSGLAQSWTCDGGSNVARYCNPAVDSLIHRATLAQRDQGPIWHEVLRRIEADAPAAFLYAPVYVFAVHRRFANAALRPESSWHDLWKWSVTPGQQIARDRQRGG